MASCYDLKGIIERLEKELREATEFKKLWENVTFPTKKDGTPFANMAKNFEGAIYRKKEYGRQLHEYELRVSAHVEGSGYISDSFDVFALVDHLTNENMLAKTENYQPKQPLFKQVYKYDLDDIKQAILDRIDYLDKRIVSLTSQIEIAPSAFATFRQDYGDAVARLEETCKANNSTLFYAVLNTVKDRYPYC
jgi:hypothetical protein